MGSNLIEYLTDNTIAYYTSQTGVINILGKLDLGNNKNITTLPEGLTVCGGLYLCGTNITTLPENLMVGGYLDLRFTQITTLPSYFTCGALFLDSKRLFSNVTSRKNCGYRNRTIFAVLSGETFYIAAGFFYGPVDKFEDAVNRKYTGEAAEAYKQAGRDCIDELKEKLNSHRKELA